MYQRPAQAPLPAGWEAKYDPGSRKWFYINHVTKTTQWDDPRLSLQQTPTPPRQPAFQHATYQKKSSHATTSLIDADPQKLKTISSNYDIDDELARSLLRTHNNHLDRVETALKDMGYMKKVQAKMDFVRLLKQDYPDALETTVVDQLVKANNSLQSARIGLEALGYKKSVASFHQPKQSTVIPKQNFIDLLTNQYPDARETTIRDQLVKSNNSVQGARLGLEALGYKRGGNATKQASTQKQVKTRVVVNEKQAVNELKRKFPNFDDLTIKMCLKVTKNDLDMAERILNAKKEDDKKKDNKKQVTRTALFDSQEEAPRDFAPKVFGSEGPSSSSSAEASSTSATSVLPKKSIDSIKSSPSTETSSQPVSRTKLQPAVKKIPLQTKQFVRHVYRQEGTYKSSLCILPTGPNSVLRKGPNPEMLSKTYAERFGPNPVNRKGPQAMNRCGSQVSSHNGSAGLAKGPSANPFAVRV